MRMVATFVDSTVLEIQSPAGESTSNFIYVKCCGGKSSSSGRVHTLGRFLWSPEWCLELARWKYEKIISDLESSSDKNEFLGEFWGPETDGHYGCGVWVVCHLVKWDNRLGQIICVLWTSQDTQDGRGCGPYNELQVILYGIEDNLILVVKMDLVISQVPCVEVFICQAF